MQSLSLKQAQKTLTELRTNDKIIKTADGFIVMTEQTKDQIIVERYADLIGQTIKISDAAKKYKVNRTTIFKWLYKGYIKVVEDEPVKLISEADIKYCVDVYNEKKKSGLGFYGAPLLNENGTPYQLKDEQRAKRRKQH